MQSTPTRVYESKNVSMYVCSPTCFNWSASYGVSFQSKLLYPGTASVCKGTVINWGGWTNTHTHINTDRHTHMCTCGHKPHRHIHTTTQQRDKEKRKQDRKKERKKEKGVKWMMLGCVLQHFKLSDTKGAEMKRKKNTLLPPDSELSNESGTDLWLTYGCQPLIDLWHKGNKCNESIENISTSFMSDFSEFQTQLCSTSLTLLPVAVFNFHIDHLQTHHRFLGHYTQF